MSEGHAKIPDIIEVVRMLRLTAFVGVPRVAVVVSCDCNNFFYGLSNCG